MKEKNQSAEHINIVVAISTFLLVVLGVALIGYFAFGNEPEELQGQMDCREYRVSAKVSGRIVRVHVAEGEYVHAGDTLATLEVPEMSAQERAAQATESAARALSDMAQNGTRHEQVRQAAEGVRRAEASRTITQKTWQRMEHLFKEGVVSEQKRDEARAAYDAATAQTEAVRSQYEMALNGARSEEKRAAAAQARAAQGGVDAVRSLLKETVQIAAVDGEVNKIYAHEGELVGSGSPIMDLNLLSDKWGVFNIREDRLGSIKQGSLVKAYSPTLNKEFSLRVYYLKGTDEYATWKATKPDKGYDYKTFEVRARPTSATPELRPGMLLVLREP